MKFKILYEINKITKNNYNLTKVNSLKQLNRFLNKEKHKKHVFFNNSKLDQIKR